MRLFKTDNLTVNIKVSDITPNDTEKSTKLISVTVGDAEAVTIRLSEPLVKAQVTDNALTRHILNFFIKE